MIKRFALICATVPSPMFAACGVDDLFQKATHLIREFNSCSSDENSELGKSRDHDGVLQRTAFNLFAGESRAEAQEALTFQGFDCKANTCELRKRDRESNLERWFGKSFRTAEHRGKRFWRKTLYKVTFKSELIERIEDIEADFRSETALLKWPLIPRARDFEVSHD